MIKENLEDVKRRMTEACKRGSRVRDDVTLICVSKTKPVEMIKEAYDLGEREFGENKAQEMKEKYELLPKDIHWHFIGHLQTNKVRYVVGRAYLIHSVDSLHLAEAIEQESRKKEVISHILLEVNVAKEESKFGIHTEETVELVKKIAAFPHIRIEGLMTIAPFVGNPEENRQIFQKLYELSVDIGRKNIDNVSMGVLSMGMTNDYEVAVEEGATYIRVGTGIFGERDYNH
ncbi:MAG: YggS family pyridoxal phosphate-dependent enzyme [Lachnospiraceae bacterium]|nr:YggS family pyridoxal phosphate-dependent enzyme [Lachnospiraceae bacterium]